MGRLAVKLLLDTHVWIWSHVEPDRLGKRLARTLEDPATELWLSPISIWEFLILAEHKRIQVARGSTPAEWVEAALARVPMDEAAVNRAVALRSRTIGLTHNDPADRFLAATADVYDLVLATSDRRLLAGRGYRTMGNR
jgi:PIN domain nuclease of toxin-antitoxin system